LADTLNPNLKKKKPTSRFQNHNLYDKKPKDNSQKQNFQEQPKTPEKPLHQAVTEGKEKVS